jgi:SPP1 gp7 family putative phage head morphogenesis protein
LHFIYDCNCSTCKSEKEALSLSIGSKFKKLLKTAEKAFKKLHSNQVYKTSDLLNTKEFQNLINDTNAIFDKTIIDNVVDGTLLENLQNDTFYFSALKTHAQLFEASQLLLNSDGKIKIFPQFFKEVQSINETYNRQYLESEYQFAIASSQMANKWSNFDNDYNLQYRTAGDKRVRDSHDKLRDTTLPKSDTFWDSFMPPNGWRCRCTVVEVLPEDYKASDSEKAIAQGELATSQIGKDGKNKLEIFRFNPGKQKVVFPPSHPYTKVAGAKIVIKEFKKKL